jgi:two-component system sensor histidine kinase UhpB
MQEQLQNITRHADANNVWITIDSKGSKIHLQVRDDGVGFNKKVKDKGAGFVNIVNRLELYNGTMDITTAPRNGCYISIIIPVNSFKVQSVNTKVNV